MSMYGENVFFLLSTDLTEPDEAENAFAACNWPVWRVVTDACSDRQAPHQIPVKGWPVEGRTPLC